MGKSILKSLRPKIIANILNGDASILISNDVRLYNATKKLIEEQGYATFYLYCTKTGGNLVYGTNFYAGSFRDEYAITRNWNKDEAKRVFGEFLNGKVVAKFTLRRVEAFDFFNDFYGGRLDAECWYCKHSYLSFSELDKYLNKKRGYAYYIEAIFDVDEPKELSEFVHKVVIEHHTKGHIGYLVEERFEPLTNAPQNFCYVESEK